MTKDYTPEQIQEAEAIAEEKISFIRHLFIYIIVNGGLFFINIFTDGRFLWSVIVAFFWGIGLAIQGVSVFVFNGTLGNIRNSLVQSELKRMKKN